ncbi:MAG: hypothetical protein SV375_17420 [Thermodesulfobacteriota bacterium]|nr:hypothetical protein [Thermodesulfobacteriota bacterium]
MLESFAKSYQLRFRPEKAKEVQQTLDSCFSLKGQGLVRSFGQLSSLVEGESTWLFRTVELLDLNPYEQSYSTHFPRIASLFDIPTDHEEFFFLDKSMKPIQRLPKSEPPNANVIEITKRIATSCKARHPLSVTLRRGHGLIYFEPMVTGGETIDDLNSLYCIAKMMCEKLSIDV